MSPADTISAEPTAARFARARALFPHTTSVVYFNSASYGPLATPLRTVIHENIEQRIAADRDDTHQVFGVADELRDDFAGLINASPREIGIGLSTTFGINIAAFGLPLSPGDEVLVSDVEFPVHVYTWRAAAETRGLKLTLVPSTNRRFDIEKLQKAISPKTKVLAVSFVQFFNGYKNDLDTLGRICKDHGLYFVVDGIQGMGAEVVDVRSSQIDIFASGCQKWMLSPQGCGFFYLSDKVRDSLRLPFGSWLGVDWGVKFTDLFHYDKPWFDSARRFEMGYYAVWNILGMKEAVRIFQMLGVAEIQRHNHALIDRLARYLEDHAYYNITSSMEETHRSSIFTFTCKDTARLHRFILDRKIILVQREGSIRVSVHLFNDESDINMLIQALDDYAKQAAG